MSDIAAKLTQMGLELPEVSLPAAKYVPVVISGNQLIVSGQLPMQDGKPQYVGKVGQDISLEEAQACAKLCGLNILGHVKLALGGDFNRVERLVRLGVFVNAVDSYTDHPKVANGVSELMVELMGDAGQHARFAVGVSGLPFGVAVEVDATFALK